MKARVAMVDGKFGLNVNGPMQGEVVELNWVLVADDIGAGSRLGCELMQVDLEQIGHLKHVKNKGLIPDHAEIQVNCNLSPFIKIQFF